MATEYTIDATGRSLGRIASEAAKALMGKMSADYTPHVRSDVRVKIVNASKLHMTEKKRTTKVYKRFTGYHSGLKKETFSDLAARRGIKEPIKTAVKRMLPRNTFLVPRLKNLTITD